MVHRVRYFERFGLVESLSRSEYEKDILYWVYEDDIEFEGIIIVSHYLTGVFRYVVVGEFSVMRAEIPFTGEIVETWGEDAFKRVYRRAVQNAKYELLNDSVMGVDSIEIEFISGFYAADEYLNDFGYLQRDFIKRQYIGCIRVSYGVGGYSIERG